jgi:hypothetical protein
VNRCPIKFVTPTKLLRVSIDANLNFEKHIDRLTQKLAGANSMLLKNERLLKKHANYSLPFIGSPTWFLVFKYPSGSLRSSKKKIQVLQNRGIQVDNDASAKKYINGG